MQVHSTTVDNPGIRISKLRTIPQIGLEIRNQVHTREAPFLFDIVDRHHLYDKEYSLFIVAPLGDVMRYLRDYYACCSRHDV